MKYNIPVIFFTVILFVYIGCTQEGKGKKTRITNSDIQTFFPLSEGSLWIYEQFIEGEIQKGNRQTDSVVSLINLDSIIVANLIRKKEDGKVDKYKYIIHRTGAVYLETSSSANMKHFCNLLPNKNDSIGEMKYSDFLDEKKSIIHLETCDFEPASYEEQLEWQGRTFQKGVGLVSFGGSELGMELLKYRIGNKGKMITR